MKKSKGDFRLRKDISKRCYTISMIMTFVVIFALWGGLSGSGMGTFLTISIKGTQ